jgi:uroporphyrinogen decarboxylase
MLFCDTIMPQIFDSWGGQLPPREWDRWSGPYIKRIVQSVKAAHPNVPLTLYANGSGGLLERIKSTGVDVVGIDWTVDMADARSRLGHDVTLQGNVDPTILFASHVRSPMTCAWSILSCPINMRNSLDLNSCHHSCSQDAIDVAVRDTVAKAGNKKHILNLGHGVLVGTPEEGVAHMFQLSKQILY